MESNTQRSEVACPHTHRTRGSWGWGLCSPKCLPDRGPSHRSKRSTAWLPPEVAVTGLQQVCGHLLSPEVSHQRVISWPESWVKLECVHISRGTTQILSVRRLLCNNCVPSTSRREHLMASPSSPCATACWIQKSLTQEHLQPCWA